MLRAVQPPVVCGLLAAVAVAMFAGRPGAAHARAGDDTAALQALLDAGGAIDLPAGTYQVSGLVIDRPGTDLRLDPAARLVHLAGSQRVLLKIAAAGATVEGGTLDGNARSGADGGSVVKINADDVTVRDLSVLDAPRAGIVTSGTDGVTIESVRVIGSGSFAIYGDSSKRGLSDFTIARDVVDRRASGRAAFEGGIKVHRSGSGWVHDVTITADTVLLPQQPSDDRVIGIETWNGVQRATIVGNRVSGGSMGISLDQTQASTVRSNDLRGFRLYGVELAGSSGNLIEQNRIACPGFAGPRGIVSDGVGGPDSTISRNNISGCSGPGIQLKPHSDGSIVGANRIVEPGPYAVEVFGSPGSRVTGNLLDGGNRGRFGVAVVDCNRVTVGGNRFSRFTKAGVLLWAPSAGRLQPERILANTYVRLPATVQERVADLDHSD